MESSIALEARNLIINADDFGASTGINRGIIESHTRGIVTSASLMVTGHAVHEAVALSRAHPGFSIGLHWDVWGEDERAFDTGDAAAVRDEFIRQLDSFVSLMGRLPTHIDSHKHAHRAVLPLLKELLAPHDIPVRDDGRVKHVGGFYAQWQWLVTDLAHVSVDALEGILKTDITAEWTELACHPGYRSPDFTSVYLMEREEEIRTLTDPRIRDVLGECGIVLRSYHDYADWAGPLSGVDHCA
jgi:chitin disaccharide deacetylase